MDFSGGFHMGTNRIPDVMLVLRMCLSLLYLWRFWWFVERIFRALSGLFLVYVYSQKCFPICGNRVTSRITVIEYVYAQLQDILSCFPNRLNPVDTPTRLCEF